MKIEQTPIQIWLTDNGYTIDEQIEIFRCIIAIQDQTASPEKTISTKRMAAAFEAWLRIVQGY